MDTHAQAQVKSHQLPTLTYDITSCSQYIVCGKEQLTLNPEEVKYDATNCCSDVHFVRPYGELGGINNVNACGCCYGWSSDLFPLVEGNQGYNMPGCFGCGKKELRDEIVAELKLRMRARGDTGLVNRAEKQALDMQYMKHVLREIGQKLDVKITIADPNPATPGELTFLV
jgi:hypothetical protein